MYADVLPHREQIQLENHYLSVSTVYAAHLQENYAMFHETVGITQTKMPVNGLA